jgi:hypothetical protein
VIEGGARWPAAHQPWNEHKKKARPELNKARSSLCGFSLGDRKLQRKTLTQTGARRSSVDPRLDGPKGKESRSHKNATRESVCVRARAGTSWSQKESREQKNASRESVCALTLTPNAPDGAERGLPEHEAEVEDDG